MTAVSGQPAAAPIDRLAPPRASEAADAARRLAVAGAFSRPDDDFSSSGATAIPNSVRIDQMLDGFRSAVERLENLLDLETQMLDKNGPVLLHDFNHRKSHGLLQLSRAMTACRALDRAAFEAAAAAPLTRLRAKLESNLASLQIHLSAVGEIAAVIAGAIEKQESDGTYTARRSQQRGRE